MREGVKKIGGKMTKAEKNVIHVIEKLNVRARVATEEGTTEATKGRVEGYLIAISMILNHLSHGDFSE